MLILLTLHTGGHPTSCSYQLPGDQQRLRYFSIRFGICPKRYRRKGELEHFTIERSLRTNLFPQSLYASQLFYVTAVGLVRISTGLFVTRLSRHGKQAYAAKAVTGLSGLWTIAAVPIIGLRGNLQRPWSTLDGAEALVSDLRLLSVLMETDSFQYDRWIAIEVSGLALEVALWLVCVSIIWSLSMQVVKRLLVLAIFGCRLL